MLPTSLVLVLGAVTPTLWLRVDVGDGSPCRVEALAAAVHVQRPDAALAVGSPPRPSDLQAELTVRSGKLMLIMHGHGSPLSRELPAAGSTCEAAIQTAALMIDRYLGELHTSGEQVSMDSLASTPASPPELRIDVGPSAVQAPFGLSPGLVLQLDLRLALLLVSLGGEANFAQSKAVGSEVPGATYTATPAAAWLALGVAPRLGPGRLFAQATFGLSLLWVSVQTHDLFQQQSGSAVDSYFGLCAGYLLEVFGKFGVAVRYEERWVPAPSPFSVEGISGTVSARPFSGDLALLASFTFF